MAESLMDLDVFIVFVDRNFVFGICKLKPKTLKKLFSATAWKFSVIFGFM